MNRESVQVVLGAVLVAALAGAVFNYSRYLDARDMAKAQAELREAEERRVAALREEDARRAARRQEELARQVDSLKSGLDAARRAQEESDGANRTARREIEKLTTGVAGLDKQTVRLQANYDRAIKELEAVRQRNEKLEAERVGLIADREKAEAARIAAENEARRLRDRAEGKGPAPDAVPDNLRGAVTAVDADLVTLSVGADAGLARGAELDVYRAAGGEAKYLGTAVVTDVAPKSATARFKPAGGKPAAGDRPRVGDTVSKLIAGRSAGR